MLKQNPGYSRIYLAGGCFWGTEKFFSLINGVVSTTVGYANGNTERPSYEDVCRRNTGHAEAVLITYDKEYLSLEALLELFYEIIDPTTVNRQGNDVGKQYRTGIYYENPQDLPKINKSIENLKKRYDKPIAIEVEPLDNFWPAEEYHQKYLDKNPEGYCHIGRDKFELAASYEGIKSYPLPDRDELKKRLTDTQYRVTQENATEAPFTGQYWDHYEKGIYVDITTGEPLFSSSDKFDSGCGWPSFSKPLQNHSVTENADTSHGMLRTEVRSRSGNAHLGHVFTDGPKKLGGLRYCINSASLRFVPKEDMEKEGYGHLIRFVQ